MMKLRYEKLHSGDLMRIREMSDMARTIVKEHFDPIIGSAQNHYMINRFQTVESITHQLEDGYQYYFVKVEEQNIGFLAFYRRENHLYLSKFYLYKEQRGKGYARQMMAYIKEQAKLLNLGSIELNVNRNNSACLAYEHLGFQIVRTEKNDIGQGFYMDDYVYGLKI